jgi:hypothetical protein
MGSVVITLCSRDVSTSTASGDDCSARSDPTKVSETVRQIDTGACDDRND